jgi:hypothetical protein
LISVDAYLTELMQSTLPLSSWSVAFLWLVVFGLNHVLFRRARNLSRGQQFILTGDSSVNARASSPRLIAIQVAFAAILFSVSDFLGDPASVFIAGGWVITASVLLAFNVRSVLFFGALVAPGVATGSVMLTGPLAIRDIAFQLFGGAICCLVIGLLTAHLALLGGALFITASGVGYLRKVTGEQKP